MLKQISTNKNRIILQTEYFDLKQTFECGQCFRWNEIGQGHYIGLVKGKIIELYQEGQRIVFDNVDEKDFENIWTDYFDFKRDYEQLIEDISKEKIMRAATEYGKGIRILCQDEWETLISFIISANNNIPRIKKILDCFSKTFGKKISYKGKDYYTFPTPEDLQGITEKNLEEIKSGYRAKYIVDAVQKINEGQVDLYSLKNLKTEEARKELLKIKGVGPKVADCILLFSMRKYSCYPIDVWIRRVTEKLYFKRESTPKEIQKFAEDMWKEKAGFAQQYLFYYARNKF